MKRFFFSSFSPMATLQGQKMLL